MKGATMIDQHQMIRLKAVIEITQLCKATIYKLRKQGKFPIPIALTERAVAWRESDIHAWLDRRTQVDTKKAA